MRGIRNFRKVAYGCGLFLVACAWMSVAFADARACSQKEAYAAEKESAVLTSWDDLYRSYRKYSHCDDAAISEGYNYSVAQLLTRRWEQFDELINLAKKSPDFERFVTSHINETMSQAEADEALRNLSNKCPKTGAKLCARLTKAIQSW